MPVRVTRLPPRLLVRAVSLRRQGRVHLPRTRLGEIVADDAGHDRVFRQMGVDPAADDMVPLAAVFDVRVRFKPYSPVANRWLSRTPTPVGIDT